MLNPAERHAKLATYLQDLEHGIRRWHLRLELARMLSETPDFAEAVTALEREMSIYRAWLSNAPEPPAADKGDAEPLKHGHKGAWLLYCPLGHELRPATREEERYAREGKNTAGLSWCPECSERSNASMIFKDDRIQDGATARHCSNCKQDTIQVGIDQDYCSKCGKYCQTAGRSWW